MIVKKSLLQEDPLRNAMTAAYRMDETICVNQLLEVVNFTQKQKSHIADVAKKLTMQVREQRLSKGGLDSFLSEYDLSSEEGIALMCLAEALLRIPDSTTVDQLLQDKIGSANWKSHLGKNDSWLVNAATWGLMLTGKVLSNQNHTEKRLFSGLTNFFTRTSQPVIRRAVEQAMRILGKQFVTGRTIEEAIKVAKSQEKRGYRYSYDMLGEAARTAEDAEHYFQSYQHAISEVAKAAKSHEIYSNPGISVKLSALSPRYDFTQYQRGVEEVTPRLLALACQAKQANISLTIDAEEADKLDLSLDIFAAVLSAPELQGWDGLGLAVQSYQKRAWYLLDWLIELAREHRKRLMIRLIKGAYWDTEIKLSQERGFEGYPVFTRKASTDVSFLACAKKILDHPREFYPQFATHNAYSVAAILEMLGERRDFEFQALHGMGLSLYDQIVGKKKLNYPCRIYAPVGSHEDLLPYLVRRLLENGANTSFVNRIVDDTTSLDELVTDPADKIADYKNKQHPRIPLPVDLYQGEQGERKNSSGIDLSNRQHLRVLKEEITQALKEEYVSVPTVIYSQKRNPAHEGTPVYDPSDKRRLVGWVFEASPTEIEATLRKAAQAAFKWDATPVEQRARYLEKAGDLIEQNRAVLMALITREGGRNIADAISEVREAADFCRYYAMLARKEMGSAKKLPGPTGENNRLELHGRGPIICVSPWNFPLAIFTGQMAAALVSGNPTIAKPAKQTPLVAAQAIKLLHQAGIPKDVLQLLPASGKMIGEYLIPDPRIAGVVFTGSTETAWNINKTLATRKGPIIPFIAETGGQNAMIVDSSALPEQVVVDVITSAFNSAGQRCSALRVLFLQEAIAPKIIKMLQGAMAELVVGDPMQLNTDVGPVIDIQAKTSLEEHAARMEKVGKLIYKTALGEGTRHGTFFAPQAYEISGLDLLPREVFGPILHVIRYRAQDLDQVIESINQTGYGLTLGIHSRINATTQYIHERVRVGNCYVNRNMIGAVVGVQPFGGEGLSGTGPKAGGPHYLQRMCTERTLTVNTTAAGGNASLLCLGDD